MKLRTLTTFLVLAGTSAGTGAAPLFYDGFVAAPHTPLENYGYDIT